MCISFFCEGGGKGKMGRAWGRGCDFTYQAFEKVNSSLLAMMLVLIRPKYALQILTRLLFGLHSISFSI